jgi:hypothetical protein
MIKYTRTGNGLQDFASQIPFIDTDQVSKNYFRVSGFPDRLYVGKNSFRISGNGDTLVRGSRIYIDVVDSNGNLIYHEVLNIVNRDKSKLIVIHVYPDTPVGAATVYIAGRVLRDPRTQEMLQQSSDPFSTDHKLYPNVMWVGKTVVVQGEQNNTPVFFAGEPKITFGEKFVSYTSVSGSSRLVEVTGSGGVTLSSTSRIIPNQYSDKSVFSDQIIEGGRRVRRFPEIENNSGNSDGDIQVPEFFKLSRIQAGSALFTKSMEGGKITITDIDVSRYTPDDYTSPPLIPDYSASIVEVINDTTIEVDNPFNIAREYTSPTGENKRVIFNSFINQPSYSISYYDDSVTTLTTDSSESFATIEFMGLEPSAGQVDRVKISYKPVGSFGDFINIGEFPIIESNFLVDTDVHVMTLDSGLTEKQIGYPKDTNDVILYWTGSSTTVTGVDLIKSDSKISDGFTITHDGIDSSDKHVVVTVNDDANISLITVKNTEYKLKFKSHHGGDTAGSNSWSAPYMDVYVSGSGLVTDQIRGGGSANPLNDLSLGTYIGTVDSKFGRKQDSEFYFIAKDRKNIKPIFVIRSGVWDIGQIELLPRKDNGFSPNQSRLSIPLNNLRQRSELVMDFKYLNVDGRPANVDSRIYGVYFEGATDILSQSVSADISTIKTDINVISGSLNLLSGSFESFSGSYSTRVTTLETSPTFQGFIGDFDLVGQVSSSFNVDLGTPIEWNPRAYNGCSISGSEITFDSSIDSSSLFTLNAQMNIRVSDGANFIMKTVGSSTQYQTLGLFTSALHTSASVSLSTTFVVNPNDTFEMGFIHKNGSVGGVITEQNTNSNQGIINTIEIIGRGVVVIP